MAAGEVLSTAPSSLNLTGFVVESAQARAPLLRKEPNIATSFISPAGNFIISVSHPIFNDVGKYQGFIATSSYLRGDNILNRLLGKHYNSDGSYLYFADQNK